MKKKETIASLVRKYVEKHPSIKDAMAYGIVNYAALGSLACSELGLKQHAAVSMALRRYTPSVAVPHEKMIVSLLRKSSIEVFTNIAVVTLFKYGSINSRIFEVGQEIARLRNSLFLVVEGSDTFTIITNDSNLERIKKKVRGEVLRVEGNLSLILIKSPEEIEQVPGVAAFMASSLACRGINVVEMMSCWKDTIFIVDEKDIGSALSALRHKD